MNIIATRLQEALNLRSMRKADLAKKSGISKAAISSYVQGLYIPKGNTIDKLAEVLHVSPLWLQGKDVPMCPTAPQVTDEMLKFALFNGADGITDDMLEEVKAFAQFVKQKK